MEKPAIEPAESHDKYDEAVLRFVRLFADIGANEKLFPKRCRTCGNSYSGFPDYLCGTVPKGHSLEDCSDVMARPFTMIYRHCACGNTLVLTLTEQTFPLLGPFWALMRQIAEETGRPLKAVVSDFVDRSTRHILSIENPCCSKERRSY